MQTCSYTHTHVYHTHIDKSYTEVKIYLHFPSHLGVHTDSKLVISYHLRHTLGTHPCSQLCHSSSTLVVIREYVS